MIAGCFRPGGRADISSLMDRIIRAMGDGMLSYHPVKDHGSFSAGFFLHPRLPYEEHDLSYYDDINDILVLFSGAIYNSKELLEQCGIKKHIPDPKLITVLFLNEGPSFVKRLNGDFAIFIGRPSSREAFLFRDHVGIRPVAYTTVEGSLCFSTDIIALCRAFHHDEIIDPDYLLGHLKYVDRRKTPVSSVMKLPPGHYLHHSARGITLTRYWNPAEIREESSMGYDVMVRDLTDLVNDAVRIRCDSRFTAGAHASGGIDSGVVSVLARREYSSQEHFFGFSYTPASFQAQHVRYDEREHIAQYSDQAGIEPLFSEMNAALFIQKLELCLKNQGFFYEDHLSDQAVAKGVNLLFSGWGGDEFLSAGDRGIDIDLLRRLRLRLFFRRYPVTRPRLFIRWLLTYVLYPLTGILDPPVARSFRDDARYLKRAFAGSDRSSVALYYFHRSRHSMHLRFLESYHLQERCERWAVSGFRKGIEYRYPLLDKRIIEYVLKIPSELFCHDGKYIFRPLIREVSAGLLPDMIRLNINKSDPVYSQFMTDIYRDASAGLTHEIEEWSKIPELCFIDFGKLASDLKKYNDNTSDVKPEVLFRGLVYIKAIQSFVVKYHEY